MSKLLLFNDDNLKVIRNMWTELRGFDLIYADFMYDNLDFSWALSSIELLRPNASFFAQTDYRSVAELKICLDKTNLELINWIVWPYDWGGRPKDAFGRKHDDILWYSYGHHKFYPERISIPKKTKDAKGFNPSGRDTKIPTDVWTDIGNFHTMDKERIKGVKWQKPKRLIERIVLATTDEGDWVLDPFMGSGTTGEVCLDHGRNFAGIEQAPDIFNIAKERLYGHRNFRNH